MVWRMGYCSGRHWCRRGRGGRVSAQRWGRIPVLRTPRCADRGQPGDGGEPGGRLAACTCTRCAFRKG